MKKLLTLSLVLLSVSAFAQGPINEILHRYDDPEKGHTSFIPKGCRTIGISGSFRGYRIGGDTPTDNYSLLSLLNIGQGYLYTYSVSPSFNYFIKDDLSLGARLDYSGYSAKADLKADLRNLFPAFDQTMQDLIDDGTVKQEDVDELSELLNIQLTGRQLIRNSWGLSIVSRKYLSFFGSKMFGVFGEGRLYGRYSYSRSCPFNRKGELQEQKLRTSQAMDLGLALGAGAAVRFRDGSTISVSVPVVALSYAYTWQHKEQTGSDAHIANLELSRSADPLAIRIGYSRFIEPKKKPHVAVTD